MAIKIGTRKRKNNWSWKQERLILKITGVKAKDELPHAYFHIYPHTYKVPQGIMVHVNDTTEYRLFAGQSLREEEFCIVLDHLERAGNNLYRINKGLPPLTEWKGRETFVI